MLVGKINSLILVLLFLFFFSLSSYGQELVIVGTGSGSSILKAVGKEFTKKYPDIKVIIPSSIGSGGGILSVWRDEYSIGRIARELRNGEVHYDLKVIPFAKMPIVLFVNNSVSLDNITSEQICSIYNSTIRHWEEINGGQGKIRVIRREDGDSSLAVLNKTLKGFKDIVQTKRSKTTYSDPATVEKCLQQKNAIAYGTLPNVKKQKGVHALSIDSIAPTDQQYSKIGFLSLVLKDKNFKAENKKLIDFLFSKEASKAIIEAGGIPVKNQFK